MRPLLLDFEVSHASVQWLPVSLKVEEGLSRLFRLSLTVYSTLLPSTAAQLLSQSGTVAFKHPGYDARYFNGIITRVTPKELLNRHGLYRYDLVLEPWVSLLDIDRDNRIFKNLSVPSIILQLLNAHPLHQVDSSGLKATYDVLPYTVQYQESRFQFVSRLMEEAGIGYYFSHAQNRHRLHLVDNNGMYPAYPLKTIDYHNNNTYTEGIYYWACRQKQVATHFSRQDYNFKHPTKQRRVDALRGRGSIAEFSEYLVSSDSQCTVETKVKQRAQQADSEAYSIMAKSHCSQLSAGQVFSLEQHPRAKENADYLVTAMTHVMVDNVHWSKLSETYQPKKAANPTDYDNTLQVIPMGTVYRPPAKTPRPVIHGYHLARVYGAGGQEIDVDDYGRVRVIFTWDAYQTPSCRIRVLQRWAGSGMGVQFIPRAGDEVIVQYINGDPSQPLIIASLANGQRPPIYQQPNKVNESGVLTQTVNSQDTEQSNGITFVDTRGHEAITIKAQKDAKLDVKHNYRSEVYQDQSITVMGNVTTEVTLGSIRQQAQCITLRVGASSITLDASGIRLSAPKVTILSSQGGSIDGAARLGDEHQCPQIAHGNGTIQSASGNVLINGLGAARLNDPLACQNGSTDSITQGVPGIYINGRPAAQLNLHTKHHGVIQTASVDVMLGGQGSQALLGAVVPSMLDWENFHCGDYLSKQKVSRHSVGASLIGEENAEDTNVYTSGNRNAYGQAKFPRGASSDEKLTTLNAPQREIYHSGPNNISYPSDRVPFKSSYFKEASFQDFKAHGPQPGHHVLTSQELYPPVIFNFRKEVLPLLEKPLPLIKKTACDDPYVRARLTRDELHYFRANGNNATLFIHGYNVPYGHYAKQYRHIKVTEHKETVPLTASSPMGNISTDWGTEVVKRDITVDKGTPSYLSCLVPRAWRELEGFETSSARTLFRDPEVLSHRFPALAGLVPDYETWRKMQQDKGIQDRYPDLPASLWQDDKLNGEGAFNWFVHMEDNLNMATGEFKRNANMPPYAAGDHKDNPYYKYTRLINIAWSGDVATLDYMDAVQNGHDVGKYVATIIKQLVFWDIEVNIIAHSLGNEVLMSCLQCLGEEGYADKVSHAFLWDAALPDDVFSSPASNPNPLYQFPDAHKVAKKITVLYSKHDNILGPLPSNAELHEKRMDPSGGFTIEAVCAAIGTMDWLNPPEHLKSVYNVANMFGKSWSYYLSSESNRKDYYQQWVLAHREDYRQIAFASSLDEAMWQMFICYPEDYVLLSSAVDAKTASDWLVRAKAIISGIFGPLVAARGFVSVGENKLEDYELELLKPAITAVNSAATEVNYFVKQTKHLFSLVREHLYISMLRGHLPNVLHLPSVLKEAYASDNGVRESKVFISDVEVKSIMDNLLLKAPSQSWELQGLVPHVGSLKAQQMAAILLTVLTSPGVEPRPALGYKGPDLDDDTTRRIYNAGKLIRADQKDYLKTHSGMKIPSKDMMEKVYKKFIIGGKGMTNFGRYDIPKA